MESDITLKSEIDFLYSLVLKFVLLTKNNTGLSRRVHIESLGRSNTRREETYEEPHGYKMYFTLWVLSDNVIFIFDWLTSHLTLVPKEI